MMKKITVLLSIFMVAALGCAGNFDSSTEKGFVTMDFDTTYDDITTPVENKVYTSVAGESCVAGASCLIIYYNGTYENIQYSGLSLRNNDNTFNLQIFKSSTDTEYTVIYKNGDSVTKCQQAGTVIFDNEPVSNTNGYTDGNFTNNSICSTTENYGDSDFKAKTY